MPPKKYAIKGEPDFHNISDEKLKAYLDLIQQMIFSYKYYNTEKTKVLEEIWKEIACEDTERLCASTLEFFNRQEQEELNPCPVISVIRKAPKLRKSPAKK